MRFTHRFLFFAIALFSLSVLSSCTTERATEEDSTNRLQAVIIDGQNNHAWKKTTPVLKRTLEATGLFTVDVATSPAEGQDMSGFNVAFDQYDVVVSNYNGTMWPKPMRQAFVRYVENGGGFVVVHAANNPFAEWPAYNEMIGLGGWGGRNEESGPYIRYQNGKFVRDTSSGRGGDHGEQHPFQVINRNTQHPITQELPQKWMHTEDELYAKLRGPAKNLTVLSTAYSAPSTGGTGEHEPMLMTIDYGQGRVFHTTLGHDLRSMAGVGFQSTLQRGTEWAATGTVTQEVPQDFPAPNQVAVRK